MGVVKWLRHRIVAPAFVGSNPIIHPNILLDDGASPSGKATDSDSVIRRFESCCPSQVKSDPLAQSVEHLTFNQGVRRSNRRWVTNLEARSEKRDARMFCKNGPSEMGLNLASSIPHPASCIQIGRHSQVVRQRSAKPLFPSSNLGVASNYSS